MDNLSSRFEPVTTKTTLLWKETWTEDIKVYIEQRRLQQLGRNLWAGNWNEK